MFWRIAENLGALKFGNQRELNELKKPRGLFSSAA
jgi:hypothetical protein